MPTSEQDDKLLKAVKNNNLAEIKEALEAKVNVNCWDEAGNTPLHIAVMNQEIDQVKLLVKNGAKTFLPNKKFETPLQVVHINSEILLYLAEHHTSIAKADVEELLSFCKEFYMGDEKNKLGDRALIDYAVSRLTGVDIDGVLRKGDNAKKYLSHLKSIKGKTISQDGKAEIQMEFWYELIFLPLRIRSFWELLLKVQLGKISNENLPAIHETLLREKIRQGLLEEILSELEMLHTRQVIDVFAKLSFSYPPDLITKFNHIFAGNIANRLQLLANGEQYCFAGGWQQHTIYIRFLKQDNKLIICADNLGYGFDSSYKWGRGGNGIVLTMPKCTPATAGTQEKWERVSTSELKQNYKMPAAVSMGAEIRLHESRVSPEDKCIYTYPCILGQAAASIFKPNNNKIPYITALIEALNEPDIETALPKIYNFIDGFVPEEVTLTPRNLCLPSHRNQTACNCVVECSQVGLHIRLGRSLEQAIDATDAKQADAFLKKRETLYHWVCDRELESVAVELPTARSELNSYWEKHQKPRALPQHVLENYKQHCRENKLHYLFSHKEAISFEDVYINLTIIKDKFRAEDKGDAKGHKETKVSDKTNGLDGHTGMPGIYDSLYAKKQAITVDELFNHGKNSSKQHFIVLGRAGIGKSTFCRYFLQQFFSGKTPSLDFKWVFHISLRHLTAERYPAGREYTESDIIRQECLAEAVRQDCGEELLKNAIASDKVLWLLDGYDELNLPTQLKSLWARLKNKSHVIIMVRPEFQQKSKLDFPQAIELEIMGFTDKDIEAYINRFFSIKHVTIPRIEGFSSTENDKEVKASDKSPVSVISKGVALLQFLRSNSSLGGITHTPIILELICSLWDEKSANVSKMNTLTMTQMCQKITEWLLQRCLQKTVMVSEKEPLKTTMPENDVLYFFSNTLTALGKLAYYLKKANKFLLTSQEFKSEIRDTKDREYIIRLGLVKPIEDPQSSESGYQFVHSIFQDFFAARYVQQALAQPTQSKIYCEVIEQIRTQKYLPFYALVWSFSAGLLSADGTEEGTESLKIFWEQLEATPRDQLGVSHLQLVIRCLEEACCDERIPHQKFYLRLLEQAIQKELSFEQAAASPKLWREHWLTLLRQTPGLLVHQPMLLNIFIQALKLDDTGVQVSSAQSAAMLLGDLGEVAATSPVIDVLIKVIKNNKLSRGIRFSALIALSKLDSTLKNPLVLKLLENEKLDPDFLISYEATRILSNRANASLVAPITPQDTMQKLLVSLRPDQTKDERYRAIKQLSQLKPTVVTCLSILEALLPTLHETVDGGDLAHEAHMLLLDLAPTIQPHDVYKIRELKIQELLLKGLNDKEGDIRFSFIEILGRLGPNAYDLGIAGKLLEMSVNGDPYFDRFSGKTLSKLGPKVINEEIVGKLLHYLSRGFLIYRTRAAKTLGMLGDMVAADVRVLTELENVINSTTDNELRWRAVWALGKFSPALITEKRSSIITLLCKIVQDDKKISNEKDARPCYENVRRQAAFVLSKLSPEADILLSVLDLLLALQQDKKFAALRYDEKDYIYWFSPTSALMALSFQHLTEAYLMVHESDKYLSGIVTVALLQGIAVTFLPYKLVVYDANGQVMTHRITPEQEAKLKTAFANAANEHGLSTTIQLSGVGRSLIQVADIKDSKELESAETNAMHTFKQKLEALTHKDKNFSFLIKRQGFNLLQLEFMATDKISDDISDVVNDLNELIKLFKQAVASLGIAAEHYKIETKWKNWTFLVTANPTTLNKVGKLLHSAGADYFQPASQAKAVLFATTVNELLSSAAAPAEHQPAVTCILQ